MKKKKKEKGKKRNGVQHGVGLIQNYIRAAYITTRYHVVVYGTSQVESNKDNSKERRQSERNDRIDTKQLYFIA